MSQPKASSHSIVPAWVDASMLQGTLRGIERESLRMQSDGYLSKQPHPQSLGSALTHPHITTDYSEALMEFITPPESSIQKVLAYLQDLHYIAHKNLPEGEKLWPMSMPCMLDQDEENIPFAQYGSSNIGRFKTLYRKGLAIRYGRRMQTISGVHYNISFPDELFEQLQAHEVDTSLKTLSLQDYKSYRYFGLIRNFIRLTPIIIFLLGASPTVCGSFLIGQTHQLKPLVAGALHLPHATALRMGKHGYQNSAQKKLGIHYNDLTGYLAGIQEAVKKPYAPFSKLGLDDENGEPRQINDHTLQIENEYYSLIRPKQTPKGSETPSQALENRGVAYVELRAVDVDPYSPIGIKESSAAFLETFALYCLLLESPEISEDEQSRIERNQALIVERGREDGLQLETASGSISAKAWLLEHLFAMKPLAELFDQGLQESLYSAAINEMLLRVEDSSQTPSAQIIEEMKVHGGTRHFGGHLAAQHAKVYDVHQITADKQQYFDGLVTISKQEQLALEQASTETFKEYLNNFR
ncbi:glutamate--cysteine ligase [Acinetobacter nectaris]|uniref:glutamate--cysteine ligase n=1 Tax=Acinetobacter nectaris TaxID=1219382 RepID=UPI001F010E09|nr:glutamate--cysteine ligase [Acinetobacter nectaris]MCF9046128.1 glutamate--cysteine ligase [Acinetobacter nectaris]